MVIGIIVSVIVVALALWAVAIYNGLVKLRNLVQEAWRQIDVELKRRHDLIGNLVETVKGYAAHERGTLEDVMKARTAAMAGGQGPAQQAQSEGMLSAALGRLFAVAEAYPDLKANQNFLSLQQELTSTEDRIAASRRYYNANVRELNTRVETVPSNIVAGLLNIGREEYFEAEGAERDPVKVDFGQRDATIPPPSGYAGASGPEPGAPEPPAGGEAVERTSDGVNTEPVASADAADPTQPSGPARTAPAAPTSPTADSAPSDHGRPGGPGA